MTNPPWSQRGDSLAHAMHLAGKILCVAPNPNLTTKAWLRGMPEAGLRLA